MPYRVQVEFRTASSFLVAYSVNLSRGGLFLETEHDIPTGAPIALELRVPGTGPLELDGMVTWRRGRRQPRGPARPRHRVRRTSRRSSAPRSISW